MKIQKSKITAKGQITIPINIRKMLTLSSGDEILFEAKNNHIIIKKIEPLDIAYLKAIQASASNEWMSEADNQAYNDL